MVNKNTDKEYINRSQLQEIEWVEESNEIYCEPDEVFLQNGANKKGIKQLFIKKAKYLEKYDYPIICDRCQTSYARRLDHKYPEHNDFTLCVECLEELGALPEGYLEYVGEFFNEEEGVSDENIKENL